MGVIYDIVCVCVTIMVEEGVVIRKLNVLNNVFVFESTIFK